MGLSGAFRNDRNVRHAMSPVVSIPPLEPKRGIRFRAILRAQA